MKQICLLIAALLVVAVLLPTNVVSAGETDMRICEVHSKSVRGESVRGRLTTENVTKADAAIASCHRAKKLMIRVIALRLEVNRRVLGFDCETDVASYHPLIAVYTCRYNDFDSPMFVKLHFVIAYYGKSHSNKRK